MTTTKAPSSPQTASQPPAITGFDGLLLNRLLAGSALPDWALTLRREACDRLATLPLPGRGEENWMRTDLRMFQPRAWLGAVERPLPSGAELPAGLLEEATRGAATTSGAVAFGGGVASLDGHVVRDELDPRLAADGVVFGAPERILAEHGDRFRSHWFSAVDSGADWFAAMHAAFHRAGAVLWVPRG
jgi:Fe-S cluster assembly scaffold protein SufB